ncbi:glycosyltransferase [bacterium]|nr:glycosyltransferase [candidate division CSSED10-310 bacterium]
MRVLLLGMCPLPTENETHTLGPGKRTWQFAKPLLHDGHRVCLVCSRHLAAYQDRDMDAIEAEEHGNLIYYSVTQRIFGNRKWLQNLHDRFEPDCVIGATVYPSYVGTLLVTRQPIWADLFGHIMAEAQTKSFVFKDDYYISNMWQMERIVLNRADVFSVVSTPQNYATIGELGTQGRLNKATTGYQFLHTIPCAIMDSLDIDRNRKQTVLRGRVWAKDDFVVLWSGGYNTWTDVTTLFNALEMACKVNPRIKFISTGGQIDSHDELTYRHFVNLIQESKYRDRFILKGWIPFNEVPIYWREADLGINIDLFTYEAILGSRNRILDWMQAGLPILTSELCELSYIIKNERLGFTFPPENTEFLADLLIRLSAEPDLLARTAERAREYVYRIYTPQETTRPLRNWVQSPAPAPDRDGNRIDLISGMQKRPARMDHYWASIKNQLKYNGIIGTAKWFSSRYSSSLRKRWYKNKPR